MGFESFLSGEEHGRLHCEGRAGGGVGSITRTDQTRVMREDLRLQRSLLGEQVFVIFFVFSFSHLVVFFA